MGWSFTSGRKFLLLLGFPEKGYIIALTTVQHVTLDEAENPETQQSIRNYYMTLESAIGADKFMLDLDVMYSFSNEEVPSQEKEDV